MKKTCVKNILSIILFLVYFLITLQLIKPNKYKNMGFDNEAKDWDKDIKKVERAKIFAEEIIDFIKPVKNMKALEFGCGTGLLSYELKDSFSSITLVDTSSGMIKVLQEKIKRDGIKNFKPFCSNLLEEELKINNFDVIYTLMTLHHILDLDKVLQIFNSKLKTNGLLCIADLVKEDGSFHSESTTFDGHNGFDKEELSAILLNHGFEIQFYKICAESERKIDGKIKKYPLFLMIIKKTS